MTYHPYSVSGNCRICAENSYLLFDFCRNNQIEVRYKSLKHSHAILDEYISGRRVLTLNIRSKKCLQLSEACELLDFTLPESRHTYLSLN